MLLLSFTLSLSPSLSLSLSSKYFPTSIAC
jgi:hypothetical protein